MANARISALSLQTIEVEVIPEQGKDPTGDVVQVAIPIKGASPTHWGTATWVTSGGLYYAQILIGPGSPFGALSKGVHQVWVKVTDNPEIPVMESPDILTVF